MPAPEHLGGNNRFAWELVSPRALKRSVRTPALSLSKGHAPNEANRIVRKRGVLIGYSNSLLKIGEA